MSTLIGLLALGSIPGLVTLALYVAMERRKS